MYTGSHIENPLRDQYKHDNNPIRKCIAKYRDHKKAYDRRKSLRTHKGIEQGSYNGGND